MNVWYTIYDEISIDEFGDETGNHYEFSQFETRELALKHVPKIRGKFKAKPIIATVEWTEEFWKKFYSERKTYDSVKVESKKIRMQYGKVRLS